MLFTTIAITAKEVMSISQITYTFKYLEDMAICVHYWAWQAAQVALAGKECFILSKKARPVSTLCHL